MRRGSNNKAVWCDQAATNPPLPPSLWPNFWNHTAISTIRITRKTGNRKNGQNNLINLMVICMIINSTEAFAYLLSLPSLLRFHILDTNRGKYCIHYREDGQEAKKKQRRKSYFCWTFTFWNAWKMWQCVNGVVRHGWPAHPLPLISTISEHFANYDSC